MGIGKRLLPAGRLLTPLVSIVAIVNACSSSNGSPNAPSASAATRVEVSLIDALKMEPGTVTVPAEHKKTMTSMPGMMYDGTEGMALKPGETKELTYTFAKAGSTLAACHEVGHYGGGMKMAITVAG